MYTSAELLSDFKFWANRPETDESMTDPQIYRLLTLAQQQEAMDLASRFPRMMMSAPTLMTTSDNGKTYTLSTSDEDGNTDTPFGHAEVYATDPNGRELYGSSYAAAAGDVVFEGNKIRVPAGTTTAFNSGPYIRYVPVPGALDANDEPTLQPPFARQLIVFRALVMWANRGGMRDARPFQEMYDKAFDTVVRALTTQYARQADAAVSGIKWWRHWLSNGGMTSQVVGIE